MMGRSNTGRSCRNCCNIAFLSPSVIPLSPKEEFRRCDGDHKTAGRTKKGRPFDRPPRQNNVVMRLGALPFVGPGFRELGVHVLGDRAGQGGTESSKGGEIQFIPLLVRFAVQPH